MMYYRAVPLSFLKVQEFADVPETVSNNVQARTFTPQYDPEENLIALSLGDSSVLSPSELVAQVSSSTGTRYAGVVVLESEDLWGAGYELHRNDFPFEGHVNAWMEAPPDVTTGFLKNLGKELKRIAGDRQVIRI